jgi:hypothetical protein
VSARGIVAVRIGAFLPLVLAIALAAVVTTNPITQVPSGEEGAAGGEAVDSPIGSPVLWARVLVTRVSPDPKTISDATIGSPQVVLRGPKAGVPVTLPDPAPAWPDRAFVADLRSTDGMKNVPALHEPGAVYEVRVTAVRPGQWLIVDPASGGVWFESRATLTWRAAAQRAQRKKLAAAVTGAFVLAELGCAAAWRAGRVRPAAV